MKKAFYLTVCIIGIIAMIALSPLIMIISLTEALAKEYGEER